MLGNRPVSRAQSAMEYLMTYGWAILIIAVVLAALFSLGVFNGTSLLGQSCVASPGFLCSASALTLVGSNTVLAFTFGQNTGQTYYNIEMACAATSNAAGFPGPGASAFNVIAGASGAGATGVANVVTAPNVANGLTLVSGQTQTVNSLPCYGTNNQQLTSTTAPLGTTFSGFLWLNYTTTDCTTGATCTWFTQKVATITAKVT